MDNLHDLSKLPRTARISSYDPRGGNRDYLTIPPQTELTIAEIKGPGAIRHIWITIFSVDVFYLRKMIIKFYWDNARYPSICCPLGDFFCLGHSIAHPYESFLMNATGGHLQFTGMNAYIPMPFRKKARIVIQNLCDKRIEKLFYHFDCSFEPPPRTMGYLHARWRREPATGSRRKIKLPTADTFDVLHKEEDGNFVLLDTTGRGRYLGCNMSFKSLDGIFSMEGDEMIVIDGDPWPPAYHGTGTEDYFNFAWGLQDRAHLFHGVAVPNTLANDRFTCYRWHVPDPINFNRSIRISFEHGHANDLNADIAGTAYWYQTEPVDTGFSPDLALLMPARSEYLDKLEADYHAQKIYMELNEPGFNVPCNP